MYIKTIINDSFSAELHNYSMLGHTIAKNGIPQSPLLKLHLAPQVLCSGCSHTILLLYTTQYCTGLIYRLTNGTRVQLSPVSQLSFILSERHCSLEMTRSSKSHFAVLAHAGLGSHSSRARRVPDRVTGSSQNPYSVNFHSLSTSFYSHSLHSPHGSTIPNLGSHQVE
jgi:hypothetical protein